MKQIRRINLFGGPGASKSRIAARLFADLKDRHLKVEYVTEFVKDWAWQGRPVESYDQVYLFGSQLHKEDMLLRNNRCDLIITDSPIYLNMLYAYKNCDRIVAMALDCICGRFEEDFSSLNIFIERGKTPFLQHGRYGTLEEAIEMDKYIYSRMPQPFYSFSNEHYNFILNQVLESIGVKEKV